MNYKNKKVYLYCLFIFLIGILTTFSLPPYNYWFINFFTFSSLFVILVRNFDRNYKIFFLYGYLFGFGYFLFSLYWIPLSLSYDDNFSFLIPFAIIIIPLFLSIFYGFAFAIFKIFYNSKNLFSNILIFSLILSFIEFLRGSIPNGFPWNLFAYSLSENIYLIQINSLIGIYSFNMVLITIFSAPSILYLNRERKNLIGFSAIFVVFVFFFIFGFLKVKSYNNLEEKTLSSSLKILSTNIPIERFYSDTGNEEIITKLIKLSNPNPIENTIFIWPEGVLPNMNLTELKNNYNYFFEKSFTDNHFIICLERHCSRN